MAPSLAAPARPSRPLCRRSCVHWRGPVASLAGSAQVACGPLAAPLVAAATSSREHCLPCRGSRACPGVPLRCQCPDGVCGHRWPMLRLVRALECHQLPLLLQIPLFRRGLIFYVRVCFMTSSVVWLSDSCLADALRLLSIWVHALPPLYVFLLRRMSLCSIALADALSLLS